MTRADFIALIATDVDTARRAVAYRILTQPLDQLVPRLIERWDLGACRYGPLTLDDGRDFAKEGIEEGDDDVVYELFEIAKRRGMV
jgi:hypothetical protein